MLLFAGGGGDNPTPCTLEELVPASVDVLLFVIGLLFGFTGPTAPVIEGCVSQSTAIKMQQHVRPETETLLNRSLKVPEVPLRKTKERGTWYIPIRSKEMP